VLYRASVAALFVSLAAVVVPAQEPERQTFRSSLDLVSVAVVVKGSNGRIVPNLRVTDFEVFDRGASQQIVQFQNGEEADARLALLVDSSGSMVMGARRERSRLAADFLIAGFTKRDAASVFSFDSRVRRLTPFTRDPDQLRDAVTSVEPFGTTGLYDAIVGTIQTVSDDAPRTRALLLLTDGLDTASVHSPADAATAAAALDIPVYVLAVAGDEPEAEEPKIASPETERLTLSDLAVRTGGLAAKAGSIAELSIATRTILTELRHQYVLAFPSGSAKGWHELTVRVKRGRVQARSRNGYLVS
jgi:VWFA-related protein